MGVSAHLHASTALPRVGHSAGLVTVEKKNPIRLVQLILILIEPLRFLLLLYNPHTWCLALLWMLTENESSNVNSVHDLIPFTLLTL